MSAQRRFSQEYVASTALSITLASLANGSGRESAAVFNATNRYQDALVQVRLQLEAGTLGNEYRGLIYAYGSEDGSTYTSPATGTNAAIVVPTPTSLALIGIMEIRDNTDEPLHVSQPMSVAQAFGWVLPRKWGIVVVNRTGRALAAGGSSASFTGIYQGLE